MLRYTAGTNKGGVVDGQLFNDPYRLGTMDADRMRYTSAAVSEVHELTEAEATAKTFGLDWYPVVKVVSITYKTEATGDTEFPLTILDKDPGRALVDGEALVNSEGKVVVGNPFPVGQKLKIKYFYNNEIIPQTVTPTSLATLTAKMHAVNLHAHARRIAVYYSQLAAFQYKNDYGEDLGESLVRQATGELAYEIDTEGVMMLAEGAQEDKELFFNSYASSGMTAISRSQYYEAFSEIISKAKSIIYKRTQKFVPTYMVVASDVLPILPYLRGYTAAPTTQINGPYFAGTADGIRIYVSPALEAGKFFFGVNGSDLQSSAAIYAPYMAIVPTQLLGFADGTMSQGFSTMYDMKLLSTYNLDAKGNPVDAPDGEGGKYSYLLVAGKFGDNVQDTSSALNVNVVNASEFPTA